MSRHRGIVTKTDVNFDHFNGIRTTVFASTEIRRPPPEPGSFVTVIIGPEPETVELGTLEDGWDPTRGAIAHNLKHFDRPGKWLVTATKLE